MKPNAQSRDTQKAPENRRLDRDALELVPDYLGKVANANRNMYNAAIALAQNYPDGKYDQPIMPQAEVVSTIAHDAIEAVREQTLGQANV